ncbi:MAG: isochorismate synthase [Chloroflexi bacterium]|nr:isochorismate synthase [Chloroflexota bacterium]
MFAVSSVERIESIDHYNEPYEVVRDAAAVSRRVISRTRPIAPLSLFAVLRRTTQRVYWEHDPAQLAFVGWGSAAVLSASDAERFTSIQRQAAELFAQLDHDSTAPDEVGPRLFGGFAFNDNFDPDQTRAAQIWSVFPTAYFVLPRYLITRRADQYWLTINQVVHPHDDDQALDDEFARVTAWLHAEPDAPAKTELNLQQITYPLDRDDWRQQIIEATDQMRAGDYDKVVLARTCDLTFDGEVDPVAALEKLHTRYPNSYRFLIEVWPGHAFYGATPELLGEVCGAQFATAALAGSRPRGTSEAEDRALAEELLTTPKERHEHALVVDSLRESLRPLMRQFDVPDEPTIYRLSNIQHLYTPIVGELDGQRTILDIVERLHPTPALGGHPRPAALAALRRLETVNRGWYAAPVGWVDAGGDGMFAAAIRSAVSVGAQARLYAGAGIVADSDPDREWDEIGLKFRPLLDALGANVDVRAES